MWKFPTKQWFRGCLINIGGKGLCWATEIETLQRIQKGTTPQPGPALPKGSKKFSNDGPLPFSKNILKSNVENNKICGPSNPF